MDEAQTKEDLASYYNEVTRFDHFIGRVVAELEEQDVLDNTLIFVLADNGRPFPRAKTRLHDSGMKTALVAHWPLGIQAQGSSPSLVSVIDLAPTILKAANVPLSETFQGVPLQPLFENPKARIREFAFSEHNWHDYEAHGRSVRDGKFLYIKNNRPQNSWQGPADSVRSPSFKALLNQREVQRLTPAQQDVFRAPRPEEELYLVAGDPQQLNNLAGLPEYENDLQRLRGKLDQWSEETGDSLPEKLSQDSFDRISGKQLDKSQSFRGTTPGEDRRAWEINASGPR